MTDSKLTSKGQIAVPKIVREALALCPGDRVRFVIHDDRTGTVQAESAHLKSLRGVVPGRGKHVTLDEMDSAIRLR